MGRSVGESVRLHVTVAHGVRGTPLGRPGRLDGTLLVPRPPQSVAPSPTTPICVVGEAPRVVFLLLLVCHPWVVRVAGPVTRRWSFECDLKEFNSVSIYTLKYRRRIQPGWCSVQLNTREILIMNSWSRTHTAMIDPRISKSMCTLTTLSTIESPAH